MSLAVDSWARSVSKSTPSDLLGGGSDIPSSKWLKAWFFPEYKCTRFAYTDLRLRIYVGGLKGIHEKLETDLILLWTRYSSLSKPCWSPPSVCRCHRCSRWQGGCAGRRSGPSWCDRPSRPRWPGCGAAPRAAPTPPSAVGAAAHSWAVLWLWAALLDRGSTARRWQISITKPRHSSEKKQQMMLRNSPDKPVVTSSQRQDTILLALSGCIFISEGFWICHLPPCTSIGPQCCATV